MKRFFSVAIVLILLTNTLIAQKKADPEAMKWWQDAKFGMFVHWGLYSVAGGDWNGKPSRGNEHFMLYERVPLKEYAKIADRFDPTEFDADLWVRMAKDAGMKYVVFTTKHHDGYAMFNSPSSDYNIVKTTKWGRDPVKELAAACKKYGLKLGLYYSLGRDWQDPDVPTTWPTKGGRSNTWDYPNEDGKVFSKYFERKVKPQVKELLTQYGPIAIMWFDTPENVITKAESKELRELIKSTQPECIINNRIGNNEGDYQVYEQAISVAKSNQPWESCITMSGKWSYNRHDNAWKSPELMIRQLVEVVSKGGDLLLNISPNGEGGLLQKTTDRMEEIGKWMKINHEAFYSTKPWVVSSENLVEENVVKVEKLDKSTMKDTDNDNTSKDIQPDIYYTAKNNTVYLFARSWKAPQIIAKSFSGGQYKVKSISLLGSAAKVKWSQDNDQLNITLPTDLPKAVPVYVFKLML